MDQAKNWIHCDGAYRLGLTGKNIGVAVLDTGIFPHRDFEDRVVCFSDFVRGRREAYDDNGHGTHIAGVGGDCLWTRRVSVFTQSEETFG